MSKDELLKNALPMFEKYGVDKLYGTTDGSIFILPNRAQLHAAGKQTVYPLNKPADKVEPKEYKGLTAQMTVDEIKEGLEEIDDLDVLQSWLDSEVGERNRSTAVTAINERMEDVIDNVDVGDGSGEGGEAPK